MTFAILTKENMEVSGPTHHYAAQEHESVGVVLALTGALVRLALV